MKDSKSYKSYVGPIEKYDLVAAMQFNLLTTLGLRDTHVLLDIGCGSLRAGKLLIPYLQKGNYYGIEPKKWLVEEGINNELGRDILNVKYPIFLYNSDFEINEFKRKFDYIIAQSIFSHATKNQIGKCTKEVSRALAHDGIFVFTFILGKDDYEGDQWVYPECVQYTPKYIIDNFNEFGLRTEKIGWHHPTGQIWYMATHMNASRILQEKKLALFNNYKIRKKSIFQYLHQSRFNTKVTRKIFHLIKGK